METKKSVKIVYNLSDAAALVEAQAGRDAAKEREVLATWDDIGRELIRPCDLDLTGERVVTIVLPKQGEVLDFEEVVKRARVVRAGSIRVALGHLNRVLLTAVEAWIVVGGSSWTTEFEGEKIQRAAAKWPECSYLLLSNEPGNLSTLEHVGLARRGLLLPGELAALQEYHARVVEAAKARQAELDATVNKDRAAQARTAREAREQTKRDQEADANAYAAACGRWLVSLDASMFGAVAEGTISLPGIESRLREAALAALRTSSGVEGLTTEEPGGEADERALPNKYAAEAAGIIKRVRESLGEVGEFVGWSAMRWRDLEVEESAPKWSIELALAFRVPGYSGKRVLSVDARVVF